MIVGYTVDDIAALRAAIATGAEEVRIGDRIVKYRTQKDLIDALRMAMNEVFPNTGSTAPNLIKATFSKGSKS